ncbi:P-loop containing nucleoside triphosphate hydrolase protein [Syncephalis plumigaleata]|nr:P-loop containing nucleoside triphosphate hydrolase protein [Syncephalis plumigaleata]
MSCIEKLLIRGIRSFDPQGTNVIEFYKPLTIIVGHNGAGKTTIIECLKYITTGDLPPNSKGGAFINDPKIAREAEVKAQIKLKFRNVNGRSMVCTRSMMLTQKKSTVSQKTLEGVLLTKDPETGEQVSLSSRCADLDADMPMQLGISKAILDNVVFCHQEESNWPLSEPSILKKKFDEIFAATRYTKALDAIKNIRKEKGVDLKMDKQKLEFVEVDHEKAKKIESMVESTRRDVDQFTKRMAELEQELSVVNMEIESAMDKLQEYQQKASQLDILRSEQQQAQSELDRLQSTMTELPDSQERLEEMLQELRDSFSNRAEAMKSLENTKMTLEKDIEVCRGQKSKLNTQLGALNAAYETYIGNLHVCEEIIRELDRDMGINQITESDSLSHEVIETFIGRLSTLTNEKLRSMDEVKTTYRVQEGKYAQQRQQMEQTIASANARKQAASRGIDAANQKISEYMAEMNTLSGAEAQLRLKERRLADEEAKLEETRQRHQGDEADNEERELDRKVREMEMNISRIDDEAMSLGRSSQRRTELGLKRRELAEKQMEHANRMEELQRGLLKELDKQVDISALESEIDLFNLQCSQRMVSTDNEHAEIAKSLAAIEAKIALNQLALEKKQEELEDKQNKIRSACGNEDLPAALLMLDQNCADQIEQVAQLRAAAEMYKMFITRAEKNHHCPLCSRDFSDSSSETQFIASLRERQAKAPHVLAMAEKELEQMENSRAALRSMSPLWDDVVRLRTVEIPQIVEQMKLDNNERETTCTSLERLKTLRDTTRLQHEAARNLQRKKEEGQRFKQEIDEIERTIVKIEEELRVSGSTKTLEECQQEREKQSDLLKTLRRQRDRVIQQKLAYKDELQFQMDAVHAERTQVHQLRHNIERHRQLDLMIEEQQSESRKLQQDVRACEAQLNEIIPKREALDSQISASNVEKEAREKDIQKDLDMLQNGATRVRSIVESLERYSVEGGQKEIRLCESEITRVDERTEEIGRQINDIIKQIHDVDKQAAEMSKIERNIYDNIRSRTLVKEHEKRQQQIQELKQECAHYDHVSYSQRQQSLKEQQSKLNRERAGLEGEVKQMQDQVVRLRHELNTDYKNIEQTHKQQFVKVKTTELAVQDMETYSKALDQAIMRYHSAKMKEVNKIIRELWISTYQGNDIDTIEIRSDHEATRGNRSYNYRVVMLKGNTELDMRGRCSAGQKVLTSLIIRLALAESFCLDCGIIALDEPTTNLDRENIESLAESLASIVRTRRKQQNFQLIIITHDEEFMQLLGKSELADYYWRVFKDVNQHSTIERQAIAFA